MRLFPLTRARLRLAGVLAVAALLLAAAVPAAQAVPQDECLPDGRCQIVNPVATADQLQLERLALRLIQSPQVVQARAEVIKDYRAAAQLLLGPLTAARRANLTAAVGELTFGSAEQAANSDPDRPRVLSVDLPRHLWFGRGVPGGRAGGANPDALTRTIPVDGASDYVLSGKINPLSATDASFSLVSDLASGVPTATLPKSRLVTAGDGSFEITVGPEPAAGRNNHLQSVGSTRQLTVQEVFGDGLAQTPYSLSVRRVWGPVAAPAREDALADEAAAILRARARQSLSWLASALGQPVNTVPAPTLVRAPGDSAAGELSAWSTARVAVGRDQALVLTLRGAGARHIGVSIADPWGLPPVDTLLRSINSTQARPNADGSYTVVVSPTDPGVLNWVDATHLPTGLLTVRWQGLPPTARADRPTLTARLVDNVELASVLPPGSGVSDETRTLQRWGQALAHARRTAEVIYTPPIPAVSVPAAASVPPEASGLPEASVSPEVSGLPPATACPTGGQNPGGDRLTPQAECAQQQVRTRFPFIQAVGGCCGAGSGKGDHPTGRAVDFMLSLSGTTSSAVRAEGDRIVAWLIANQALLHVKYIGWWQHIWYPNRGWQIECLPSFARCGLDGAPTVTSMHEDHVHLSVR